MIGHAYNRKLFLRFVGKGDAVEVNIAGRPANEPALVHADLTLSDLQRRLARIEWFGPPTRDNWVEARYVKHSDKGWHTVTVTIDGVPVTGRVPSQRLRPQPGWRVRVPDEPTAQDVIDSGAFASLSGPRGSTRQETMIHVYWSALNDDRDRREGGRGHLLMRDKVCADLGLDTTPVPGFTEAEMQSITYAAKMAAIKCLGLRARKSKKEPK